MPSSPSQPQKRPGNRAACRKEEPSRVFKLSGWGGQTAGESGVGTGRHRGAVPSGRPQKVQKVAATRTCSLQTEDSQRSCQSKREGATAGESLRRRPEPAHSHSVRSDEDRMKPEQKSGSTSEVPPSGPGTEGEAWGVLLWALSHPSREASWDSRGRRAALPSPQGCGGSGDLTEPEPPLLFHRGPGRAAHCARGVGDGTLLQRAGVALPRQ